MTRHRVVVVSATDAQPRYHKRVQAFLDAGCEVTVYTFRRSYYRVNRYPGSAEVVELGTVEDARYLSRLPTLLRGLRLIRQREARRHRRAEVLYCFGFDCAVLGLAVGGRRERVIYEIGDLRRFHFERSAKAALFRRCEAALLRKAAAFVVTAPAMLDEYFGRLYPDMMGKGLVLENRLPHQHFPATARAADGSRAAARIRIGLIGFLRYPESLHALLQSVIPRQDRFELHIHGDGPLRDEVERAAADQPHVTYHGPFMNPSELAPIYAGIDLNYVVYDNADPNVRMAIPNKLYESAFFGVPLMVATETALASRVLDSGMGLAVDPREEASVGGALDQLDRGRLQAMAERARAIPASDLLDDGAEVLRLVMRGPAGTDGGTPDP